MAHKWTVYVIGLWVIMGVLGALCQLTVFNAPGSSENSAFNTLSHPPHSTILGVTLPLPNLSWLLALGQVLTLGYDFVVENPVGGIVWLLFLLPLTLMMMVAVLTVLRGSSSS